MSSAMAGGNEGNSGGHGAATSSTNTHGGGGGHGGPNRGHRHPPMFRKMGKRRHGGHHGHGGHHAHHMSHHERERQREEEERKKKEAAEEAKKDSVVYFQLVSEVKADVGREPEPMKFEGPEIVVDVLRELIAERKKMLAVDVDILHEYNKQPYPPEALIPNKTFVWVKRRPTLKTRIQIIESEAASRDYRPTPASPGSDEDGNNVLSRLTRKEIIPEEWPPEFLCPVCAEPLESATFVKCCRATVCEKCVQEDDEGNCSLCHEIWEGTVRDVLMRGVMNAIRREWYYTAKEGPPPAEIAMSPIDEDDEDSQPKALPAPAAPSAAARDQRTGKIKLFVPKKKAVAREDGASAAGATTQSGSAVGPSPGADAGTAVAAGAGAAAAAMDGPQVGATTDKKDAKTTSPVRSDPKAKEPVKLSASAALAARYAAEEQRKANKKKLKAAKSDANAKSLLHSGTGANKQGKPAAASPASTSGVAAAVEQESAAPASKPGGKSKKVQIIDGVEYLKTNVGLVPRAVYEQAWAAAQGGAPPAGTQAPSAPVSKKRKREGAGEQTDANGPGGNCKNGAPGEKEAKQAKK
eukprot:g14812.t1